MAYTIRLLLPLWWIKVDQAFALDAYIEHLEGRLARCWRDALLGPDHTRSELFATILLLEEARKQRVRAERTRVGVAA